VLKKHKNDQKTWVNTHENDEKASKKKTPNLNGDSNKNFFFFYLSFYLNI